MKLKGKRVLVTGASSGLGFSLAKVLVRKRCEVYGIGKTEKNLRAAEKKLKPSDFKAIRADVTDAKQITKVVRGIGSIDILINNAGVWLEGGLEENSVEKISETIDVNLKGVIYATRAVLPQMLRKNVGFIINISSTSGLRGRGNESVYVASKFGVTGFTKSLQEDLKKTNIKVAGFYPGGMNTKMFEKAGITKENRDWMDTDKVAEIVVFMLERDETMILDHVVLNKRGTKTTN